MPTLSQLRVGRYIYVYIHIYIYTYMLGLGHQQ